VSTYSLPHLSDSTLLCNLTSLVAQDRATTAALLAHPAEVDARKLYLELGYPSMFTYCVGELRMSEDVAFKRIKVARAARRFPAIFDAVVEGGLHLSAVVLLAPHLRNETADELLAAATHKAKSEIEQLLAERFPRPDVLAWVAEVPAMPDTRLAEQQAPGPVADRATPEDKALAVEPAPSQQAPGPVGHVPRMKPVSLQSFAVQFTLSRNGYDKLRYAQELLGHQVSSGDLAEVFDRALEALIHQLEKQKFAATARPHRSGRPSTNPRHIPAEVKRAVWERDGGQCTFVGRAGNRCPARTRLEFDHVQEVARGGGATVAGIRLRCRAHNQYGAECAFGQEFIRHKCEAARRRAEARRQEAAAQAAAEAQRKTAQARVKAAADEVIQPLRQLGFRADEARRAAALREAIPEASIEQRIRRALSYFHPPRTGARSNTGPERMQ
jgi:hypothetical protein